MADRIVAEGKFLRLVDRDGWELVERRNSTGVVAIVAITAGGELVLTEQYRPAVRRRVVDLPAGLAGDVAGAEDERLAVAANRELVEEVGYEARVLHELAAAPPSPGMSSEMITFFLAEGLTKVGPGGGVDGEAITIHEVPLAELGRFLEQKRGEGALVDLKLYAGLYLARGR